MSIQHVEAVKREKSKAHTRYKIYREIQIGRTKLSDLYNYYDVEIYVRTSIRIQRRCKWKLWLLCYSIWCSNQ